MTHVTSSIDLANLETAYLASLGAFPEPQVAAKKSRAGRLFAKSDVITVLTRNHGMREGAVNLRRFLAIASGITVQDAHDLGIDNGYLAYYVRNKLIAIGPAIDTNGSVTAAVLGC